MIKVSKKKVPFCEKYKLKTFLHSNDFKLVKSKLWKLEKKCLKSVGDRLLMK